MSTVEYTSVFVRVAEERLDAIERLVLALPALAGDALANVELAFGPKAGFLAVRVELHASRASQKVRDRLVFWTARAGGRATASAALSSADLADLRAHVAACALRTTASSAAELADAATGFFREAGAPPDRRPCADGPVLAIDVSGPGAAGVRYVPDRGVLFVAAPIAPPAGDAFALVLRAPGLAAPAPLRARVVEVIAPAAARPGHPAGYALRLDGAPAAIVAALEAHAAARPGGWERAAPRFPVNAPVKVLGRIAPATIAQATIEYATDQELAADFVENLSQGGAFVRTSHPPPVGTEVALALKLPNGGDLRARAQVAFVNGKGMGVRFALDAATEDALAAAIARISARPRRALVVDDDALVRRMLSDALAARGFEVVTAPDAAAGLRTLAEELLALDLLLTDVAMPGMDGEELVRRIRTAGGESDLAIVVASARLDPGTEARLEAAGADAVVDKALGPELVAQAADAVLERKALLA